MFSLKETCLPTAVLWSWESSGTAGVAPDFVMQKPLFGKSIRDCGREGCSGPFPPRVVRLFSYVSNHSANAQHALFEGARILSSDSWLVACLLGLQLVRSSSSGIITTIIIQVYCSAIRYRNEMEMIEDEMVLTSYGTFTGV
jgi:hypothetical protein